MALLARSARNAFLESRCTRQLPTEPRFTQPLTLLLPLCARITTVSHTLETGSVPEPLLRSGQHIPRAQKERFQTPRKLPTSTPPPAAPTDKPSPHSREDVVSTHITPTIRHLLPLLHSQPSHYMTIHLHGRPYLVTKGDTIRLPFLMPRVEPGDILRLNRATHIGSRNYTLKAPEVIKGNADHGKKVFYLDERIFTCRARVLGIESEPVRVMEKTKRRQRHVKHVFSKHDFTVLKISELQVRSLKEYEGLLGPGETVEEA